MDPTASVAATNEVMTWDRLFSDVRLGQEAFGPKKGTPARTDFQIDFDRIVYSSAFRRLQNKTQVIPLPEKDFVRNRLTHSLETSCVGRSLGSAVGQALLKKHPDLFGENPVRASDFGGVVAAACLSHDIGNPPFGHSGEDAISEYFRSDAAQKFLTGLNDKQIADLQNFEGNAAGFRILTHTLPSQSEHDGGIHLTYTTLATFTKYPKESLPNLKKSGKASEKKYGFFQSERDTFKKIAEELGLLYRGDNGDLRWYRHPLSFLVEAADDICYHIIDFEDGYKLGFIQFHEIERLFTEILGGQSERSQSFYDGIYDEREKISFLRARAINRLVSQVTDFFLAHEADFLDGSMDRPLTEQIKAAPVLQEIIDISIQRIYRNRPTLEIEAAGFEVMSGLLEAFLGAVLEEDSKHAKKIKLLLPDQYLDKGRQPFPDRYTNVINITMFIAGMTDTYAINLYRRMKGISLPNEL